MNYKMDEFLQELQILSRKYDACIHDGGLYYSFIGIDRHSHTSQRIDFPTYMMEDNALDAENIMYDGIN